VHGSWSKAGEGGDVSEWEATYPDPLLRLADGTTKFVHHYKWAILASAAIG